MENYNKNERSRGITLIALVITIVVLIILAGISIVILIGDNGLIARTIETKEESRGATVAEEAEFWRSTIHIAEYGNSDTETLQEILERLKNQKLLTEDEVNHILNVNREITIGSKVISFTEPYMLISDLVKSKTVKIGDYVNYKPNNDNYSNVGWRVLDVTDDGLVRLISDRWVASFVANQEDGYNNVVYELNNQCNSNYSRQGVGEATAVKIEDLEKHLTYDFTTSVKEGVRYGDVIEREINYPNILLNQRGVWINSIEGTLGRSEQISPITGSTMGNIRLAQTAWDKNPMIEDDFEDLIYYELFNNTDFASRSVILLNNSTSVYFGVYTMSNNSFFTKPTTNYPGGVSVFTCAVVTLSSGVRVDINNSEEGYWKLKY